MTAGADLDPAAMSCTPCQRGYHLQCAGQTWHWTATRLAAVWCGCTACTPAGSA